MCVPHCNSSLPSSSSESLFLGWVLECACFKTLRRLRLIDQSIFIWLYQWVDVTRDEGIMPLETSRELLVSKPVFLNFPFLSSHTIFSFFVKLNFSQVCATTFSKKSSPFLIFFNFLYTACLLLSN